MATAHEVGRVADFPVGSHRVVRVGAIEVGVFNVGGRFYALPNLCIHQWGPLCAGVVSGTLVASAATDWRHAWAREGEIVICPWHSLEFDIATGQCLAYPRVTLRRYPVEIEDGVVKVLL